jgi:RNA polymerase sigma-70 factor (ECF subfamily)
MESPRMLPTAEPSDFDPENVSHLVQRAAQGDAIAVDELFSRFRVRLKRMIHLRLNRRLQGRVDDSDIIQEAFLDASRKLPEYAKAPQLPFYLWLRHLTGLKLTEIHRRHLGTQMRDAAHEVSLHRGCLPGADSMSLAAYLLGTITSVSQAAIKAEKRLLLQESLNSMEELDREVIALKHFEQLTISEIAQVLEISRASAGRRYLKALKRLRAILTDFPEFNDAS